ncbi:hypothetical protein [Mesorhizobium sp. LSHC414A00]|uniref:hypothetical protein n=1 Tax=Mesorhizobium sp. LSHC414A00 TaxID=1287287 RepID=UPI0012EC9DC7|nr:hypothetical protein [Mesorhizobium sp. LSHC414A00]
MKEKMPTSDFSAAIALKHDGDISSLVSKVKDAMASSKDSVNISLRGPVSSLIALLEGVRDASSIASVAIGIRGKSANSEK